MRKLIAVLCVALAGPAFADNDIELGLGATQSDFKEMSEDLVAAIDYKSVSPAEATGITGVGVGVIFNNTAVDNESAWRNGAEDADISRLNVIGLGATKGLPGGVDVGLFYGEIMDSDVSLLGGEIRYAFLKGNIALPAIAVRAAHVTASGIDTFDLSSTTLDVSVSKGFAMLTPYAGIGYVMGSADPDSNLVDKEEVNEVKYFVGARLGLGLFEITPEIHQVGDNTAFNLRAGFSFAL